MMTPDGYQEEAAYKLSGILSDYNGAILQMDEGLGKTITGALTCDLGAFSKVLWVCPAASRPNTMKKLKALKEIGIDADFSVISYDKFGNPRTVINTYDLIIFDECHYLRNWSASYTKRFTRLRQKFLAMSATPEFKSIMDCTYVIRKTGAFGKMSADAFKVKYFGAVPSNYGRHLVVGDFQNKEEFFTYADRTKITITHESAGIGMGKADIDLQLLEGTYKLPKDITESTACRIHCGKLKVAEACERIAKRWRGEPVLILTQFHDVAMEAFKLLKILRPVLALDAKQVGKAFESQEPVIITTGGLTKSGFDANYIDNVHIIESSYSFLQDRQSIRRCLRRGKKHDINVVYYHLENEIPLMKSLNRRYLEDYRRKNKEEHSKFGPSSLAGLEKCPGSYWMENYQSFEYAYSAFKGHKAHEGMEVYIKNRLIDPPRVVVEECGALIQYARRMQERGDDWGCEDRVSYAEIRADFFGTVDFWHFDRHNKILTVVDLKSGRWSVDVKNNLQLLAYTLMVENGLPYEIEKYRLKIFQGGEFKSVEVTPAQLEKARERIIAISEDVDLAKERPQYFLDPDCRSPFCRSYGYHMGKRERG